jgi:hypothetical protein
MQVCVQILCGDIFNNFQFVLFYLYNYGLYKLLKSKNSLI